MNAFKILYYMKLLSKKEKHFLEVGTVVRVSSSALGRRGLHTVHVCNAALRKWRGGEELMASLR